MNLMIILLALSNGLLVTFSRMVNARLGKAINPAGASVWNHLTGTLAMGAAVLFMGTRGIRLEGLPFYVYCGGLIGGVYVTISNYLIPKIGASKATVLMIAGQIILAAVLDILRGVLQRPLLALGGIILIIAGVYAGEKSRETAKHG